MIKAIIFDFDGTLSNRWKNAYGVFDTYLRKWFKDLDDLEYEAILQDLLTFDVNGMISVEQRVVPFINKYHLPEEFVADFKTFYYDNMFKFVVLKDDMLEVLNTLKGNYKLAILSNGDSKSQHNKIDAANMDERYFDKIYVSGDLKIHKPQKEVFEYVANALGVKCEECLFVGDVFSSDIIGAIRANMTPVWINSNTEIPSKYYKGYRINKIKELLVILDELKD